MNTKKTDFIIKIDTDVPIPPRGRYPWRQMKVGDSFFEGDLAKGKQLRSRHSQIRGDADTPVFTTKMVVEDGMMGYRVWRIK